MSTGGLGYLGPEGSFSHQAARRWLAISGCSFPLVPAGDLPALFASAERGKLEQIVCPLENSLEGSVALVLDLWLHESTLRQVGEVVLPVQQWLLVRPGVPMRSVSRVLSHPHALAQCRRTIASVLPGVPQVPASSTAEAARLVAQAPQERWAAVGSLEAARRWGLEPVLGPMEDGGANVTRFGILGWRSPARTGRDRTTLVVGSLEDRPGLLRDILDVLARRGLNLTRIESRPSREGLGRYLFLMDMEGHATDPGVADALASVRRLTGYLRLLGSYPCDPAWGGPASP
ncbi:prephenate dehydratase [Carboxydochorda subterranea]|uniref:Prephenate dehydratase n=1 Tax=Carboxydichorda subterranea TaxID=3109565 RepID=A0ABZ1BWB9_9FIRM|nr:prephenate dehydratase [Limnochorda sp. L945t]WRP17094.1 prephenate dehydratase [Limnochorda sp. L945t]